MRLRPDMTFSTSSLWKSSANLGCTLALGIPRGFDRFLDELASFVGRLGEISSRLNGVKLRFMSFSSAMVFW
jgi:hypothetical protein